MIFHEQRHPLSRQRARRTGDKKHSRERKSYVRTFTIHVGVFCLHPSTRSVLMIPVRGSTERSTTSTLMTCEHLELGYLCHIPIMT